MKNKKLFAILTLVCFMFTLMPVAAFAAEEPVVYADEQVYVGAEDYDKTPAEDPIAPATEIEVMAARTFYAGLGQGTSELKTTGLAFYAVDADNKGVAITTTGSITIKMPGDYQIFAVPTTDANKVAALVANANDITNDETPATAVAKIQSALDDSIYKAYATVTVVAPEANYKVELLNPVDNTELTEVTVKADNGFTGNKQVKVRLTNNTKAVVGKVPEITAPDYVTVVPVSAKKVVTDANGYITYNVSANRGGNFEVVFAYEDATEKTLKVNATDDVIANIELVKSATNAINKKPVEGVFNTGATLKFTDASGSVKAVEGEANEAGLIDDNAKVTVISQPATSKLAGKNFALVESKAVTGGYDLVVKTTSELKVGSYEVKVALANGKAVTVEFEAAKMGDVVGIRFVQPATTVALGSSLTKDDFKVQAYDANGVVSYLGYSADASVAQQYTLSASGKALDDVLEGKIFTVQNEEKYIGSTITVLAKTGDNKFVATTTVEVVEAGQEVVYKTNTAEVGVTTKLTANVLDSKGNKVDVNADKENIKIVVLEKPAKAYVNAVATDVNTTTKDITVEFLASAAGEYKIQTIVLVDNNEYVTGVETIVVGGNEAGFEDVVVISIGADKMIVNDTVVALDVAPFIENNRTMMQFNVLYVFGIDVEWVAETQSIVAEGEGLKVVMQLGSKVATVNGEEVTLDVAPYSVNGRTVVPVGFITGLLDITPTFTYNADGTIADILFTK